MRNVLLFDLDGTLHDRQRSVDLLIRDQHRRRIGSSEFGEEDFCSRFLELDQRGYAPKVDVYGRLLAEFGLPDSMAEDLAEDFASNYSRFSCGFDGLHETLGLLRGGGYRMAVITNGSKRMQSAKVASLAIEQFFQAVLISEEVGVKKPDPLIFHLALERLNATPGEAVFVGDHPQIDIAASQSLGLKAVWVRDDFWGPCAHADAIINHLAELPSALLQLS